MPKQDEPEIVELTSEQVGVPLWLLVSRALRSNYDQMHGPALALCEALGPVFQSLLITELRLGKLTPQHRVRLLQAIGRTGPIAPVGDVANLFISLVRDKHPAVREAAAELLYHMPDRQRMATTKPRTSEAGGGENPRDGQECRRAETPGEAVQ